MDWLIAYVAGVATDFVRSVFFPATNKWIYKYIPGLREKENLEESMLVLSIMEKLKILGRDEKLVKSCYKVC